MRTLTLLTCGLLILASCHKDEEVTIPSHIIIENHQLYLDSTQRIVKIITTAEDNKFMWEANYFYSDSLVIKTITYSSSEKSVTRFKIGKKGFAEYSVDSSNFNMYPDTLWYFYNSYGYLLSSTNNAPSPNDDSTHYYYTDGDLLNVRCDYVYYANYSYYDTLNRIDIIWNDYGNGIAGKINKHLIKQEQFGIPALQYKYQYSLDQEGYVIEETKTNIPDTPYNLYIYKYRYSYIFNYVP